ncbi:PCNA-interacting partner isoform X2 [Hydra vulgaris]|uniref:PCNA-interacting partner isoform X2 n=1 Tax=Hydra vulgaris TaxID=6087 RepID=UPI001F5E56FE|nr:PCNA-interacting partner isoform X2 [Hydra vulgaris]
MSFFFKEKKHKQDMGLYELLKIYRSSIIDSSILKNRSTFLSETDQLAALQLSFILLQKKLGLNTDISSKELFSYRDIILRLKDNTQIFDEDEPDFKNKNDKELYNSYNLFLKHCNMIDEIDVKNSAVKLIKEQPSGGDKKDRDVLSPVPKALNTDIVQFRRVVIGYLQLLVNSRDEIALARVIDLPSRGIDHAAFTEIRKHATKKSMSMYQVVCSFSRQILLGGKGYHPDNQHILFKHKEGLVNFIQLVDELQTALDDSIQFKDGIKQILKILKNTFIKCKTPVFSSSLVSQTLNNILMDFNEFGINQSTDSDKILLLRDFLDYMSCKYGNNINATSSLCGILSTPVPNSAVYVKLTTFSTKFRTPEVNEETPKKIKLSKQNKENSCARPLVELQTGFSEKLSKYDEIESPSPFVCIIRCLKSPLKEVSNQLSKNILNETRELKKEPSRFLKRKNSRKLSSVSKKLNLLPGQQTITSFFNMT